jgi:phospholipid-binding lipoprotein MlaA
VRSLSVDHAASLPLDPINFKATGATLKSTTGSVTGLLLGLLVVTAGCATPPSDPAARAEFEATNDPLEPMNREIFDFNQFLDRILIKPLAEGYRTVVPQVGRNAIRHFLDNLGEPVIFANDVLQGDFERANLTVGRFLLNSTFGGGGLADLATDAGAARQPGDFGQTLYTWGLSDGPYLVLPVLGPSDVRDTVGLGVDIEMDPFDWLAYLNGYSAVSYGRWGLYGIDERSRSIETIEELKRTSVDFYAQIRSLYRQHRASVLKQGAPTPIPGLDTLDEQPDTQRPQASITVEPLGR